MEGQLGHGGLGHFFLRGVYIFAREMTVLSQLILSRLGSVGLRFFRCKNVKRLELVKKEDTVVSIM